MAQINCPKLPLVSTIIGGPKMKKYIRFHCIKNDEIFAYWTASKYREYIENESIK